MLNFTKMNGAGNDFVMLDNREGNLQLDKSAIARLCDRHRGIGADGLLMVEPAQSKEADFRMRYYNADGGEAEMCGNGARCFARYASRLSGLKDSIRFETLAGIISAKFIGERVRLAMSTPGPLVLNEEIALPLEKLLVSSVNTGVPHAVVFVEDLQSAAVEKLGAAIRYHEHFAPKGTNANFVQQLGPQLLGVRTYERGVEGETLACGTGVCASALIFSALSGAAGPISVQVRGGDTLDVGFQKEGNNFSNVTLTGPADLVFEGSL